MTKKTIKVSFSGILGTIIGMLILIAIIGALIFVIMFLFSKIIFYIPYVTNNAIFFVVYIFTIVAAIHIFLNGNKQ